jgi:2-iminobutanoate/2-iminopropanoate deaminase
MTLRKSIAIESLSHLTAIPVATKIGPLLVSSVIAPFNPGVRVVPDTVQAQYANIFDHVGLMLREAGADWRHVAKMEFWTPSVERDALDPFWIEKFPDEASRPSRHTHVGEGKVVTATFIAYVTD